MKPWAVGLGLFIGGVLFMRRARAAGLPGGDAGGDNWGTTPAELRPLFLRMEEAAGIPGSARFFAVVSAGESRWNPSAHNDRDDEVESSRRAYENNAASRPALAYGQAAAAFGSGGLFGQLAPYFLWSASAELKDAAPLLGEPPTAIFQPRLAAYGAVVLLRRLVLHYDVRDVLDARVGWAAVSLLNENRGSATYLEVRSDFAARAQKVGIDLSRLPARFEAGPFPGFRGAYDLLVSS